MSSDLTPDTGSVDHDSPGAPAAAGDATASETAPPERDLTALIIPVVLVAVGAFLLYGTATMDEAGDGGLFGAKTFPRIVAGLSLLVALAMTIDILRPKQVPTDEAAAPEAGNWQALGTVVGALVFFILTLEWLGWLIAATVLFTLVAIGLGNRRYLSCLLGGIAIASVTQIVFSGFLEINLPSGIIGGF